MPEFLQRYVRKMAPPISGGPRSAFRREFQAQEPRVDFLGDNTLQYRCIICGNRVEFIPEDELARQLETWAAHYCGCAEREYYQEGHRGSPASLPNPGPTWSTNTKISKEKEFWNSLLELDDLVVKRNLPGKVNALKGEDSKDAEKLWRAWHTLKKAKELLGSTMKRVDKLLMQCRISLPKRFP